MNSSGFPLWYYILYAAINERENWKWNQLKCNKAWYYFTHRTIFLFYFLDWLNSNMTGHFKNNGKNEFGIIHFSIARVLTPGLKQTLEYSEFTYVQIMLSKLLLLHHVLLIVFVVSKHWAITGCCKLQWRIFTISIIWNREKTIWVFFLHVSSIWGYSHTLHASFHWRHQFAHLCCSFIHACPLAGSINHISKILTVTEAFFQQLF